MLNEFKNVTRSFSDAFILFILNLQQYFGVR